MTTRDKVEQFMLLTEAGQNRYQELVNDGKLSHEVAFKLCSRSHGLKRKYQPSGPTAN
jgi:hypothetical protein